MRVRWLVPLTAVLAAVGGLAYQHTRPREVSVARVSRGLAEASVYASGTVEARDRVEVKARVPGPIAALLVHEGDRVQRGDVLARIEAPSLGFDLERGRVELTAARARAGLAPQIAALEAQAAALEAQRAQAESDLQRTARLVGSGAAPAAELERARSALAALREQLAGTTAQRRDLAIVLGADLARQRAMVASLEARASDAEIRAPIAGVVLARRVEPGEVVVLNQNLLRLGDLSTLQIEAQVDEADVARVRVGMPARVRCAALGSEELAARVVRVAPDSDRERRTFQVDLALLAPPASLRPGMSTEVTLVAARNEHALLVPADAIHGRQAWVVDRDDRLARRDVQTGIRELARVEIVAGLHDGDRVVLGEPSALAEGVTVRARESGGAL